MTDSIFALATSAQRSALHLHRLSGHGVFETILPYLYVSSSSGTVSSRGLTAGSIPNACNEKAHFAFPKNPRFPFTHYVTLNDEKNTILDDVIITFFRAPKSFTGEDVIEISCHGNPLISQKLQSFFRHLGLRDAREGEFTNRAFLHGKLDLAQAEGIRELIHAETHAGVQLSRNQLNGVLGDEIAWMREKFTDILSYLEAHIDFSTDEIGSYEPQFLIPKLHEIENRLCVLKNSYATGIKIKEGLKIVLCGKPNVGKSTLYNALLKSDRAIVTDIAGTTRDVLTERLVIENRDFVLMDTAGIRYTKNIIEKLGVERSLKALNEADIVCVVIDGTKSTPQTLKIIEEHFVSCGVFSSTIFVISKSDLIDESKIQKLSNELKKYLHQIFSNTLHQNQIEYPIVSVSRNDITEFKKCLTQKYDHWFSKNLSSQNSTAPILISARSHDKVESALVLLEEAFVLLKQNDAPEKVASVLYSALKKLEEILGEIDLDEVYQKIFSTFCIGK